jgi:hypothetical protein
MIWTNAELIQAPQGDAMSDPQIERSVASDILRLVRRLLRRPDPESIRLAEECGCGLCYDSKGNVRECKR